MKAIAKLGAAVSLVVALCAVPHLARAVPGTMAGMSEARYLGAPDLGLTAAMIAAGGGSRFSSARLLAMLTAQHHDDETARLAARFGQQRTRRFFATFDAFVGDAVANEKAHHLALPRPDPALETNSYELAASLRRDGIMPDGRFDVGYFIEHLLSRPMHVQLMRDVDADPAIGPVPNADFHVILTAAMDDLRRLYGLPQ